MSKLNSRLAGCLLCLICTSSLAVAGPLEDAIEHLQRGRYEAAREAFTKAAEDNEDKAVSGKVAVGVSRLEREIGNWEAAETALANELKTNAKDAGVIAELARVRFQRGDFEKAEELAQSAIKIDADQAVARMVLADVFTETGRIDEALNAYRWFVRFYNRVQPEDAERLLLIADGAAQYARWKSVSQIFNFVINTLCPDALKADETSWQSYHVSGLLLLEKYNRGQALPEFRSALAINPHAADLHVAMGEAALQRHKLDDVEKHVTQALEINARSVSALQLQADLLMARGELEDALARCDDALKVNPKHQATLARKAAIGLISVGVPEPDEVDQLLDQLFEKNADLGENAGQFEAIAHAVIQYNSKPGTFLTFVAKALESQRRFGAAECFYRRAIDLMPQLSEPKTALGMLYMRIGQTDKARTFLDAAFKADPYHVRVSNMRKVLKVLEEYDTIKTDHFIVHVDTKLDRVLGEYMAEYLEEVYPELVKHFGYEPEHRTHFEIYNNAKGLSAHQWFSARMVGLPWIQTIGASTGVIVAMASPTAKDEPYNWARVVKHEFTHVITLQQTKFNIPHWFTEALAVTAEGYPRPQQWDKLLLERVPAGKLWSLDELNMIFRRPESPSDWQFAYCQSRLYAQYMIETYGEKTISKMLDSYRRNVPTKKAIPQVFEVSVEEFEAGYHKFLDKIVGQLSGGDALLSQSLEQLKKAYDADESDLKTGSAYAMKLLQSGDLPTARQIAKKILDEDPSVPLAAVVIAGLELRAANVDGAAKVLEAALDKNEPHPTVVKSLMKLRLKAGDYKEAARLASIGLKVEPQDREFLRGRVGALIELKDDDKSELIAALEAVATSDAESASARKQLAQLHLAAGNHAKAAKFAKLAMHVDVVDAETHTLLGLALVGEKNLERAIREFEVAAELKPGDNDIELHLARALLESGDKSKAKKVAEAILARDADHKQAAEILQQADE